MLGNLILQLEIICCSYLIFFLACFWERDSNELHSIAILEVFEQICAGECPYLCCNPSLLDTASDMAATSFKHCIWIIWARHPAGQTTCQQHHNTAQQVDFFHLFPQTSHTNPMTYADRVTLSVPKDAEKGRLPGQDMSALQVTGR